MNIKVSEDLCSKDKDDLLTLSQAAAVIVERDFWPHDTQRSATDRARKRIVDASKRGLLSHNANGKYRLGDIGRWARIKWEGDAFNDLPTDNELAAELPPLTAALSGGECCVIPDTLEDCQAALLQAHHRKQLLENEVAELRPHAERYRHNANTNGKNASKAAKGR